jgi:hypothetical protein
VSATVTIEQATEALVAVTAILRLATIVLAAIAVAQLWAGRGMAADQRRATEALRSQAEDQRAATEVLREQARALAAAASASDAMAGEMLAARTASNHLELRVEMVTPARPGHLTMKLTGVHGKATIITSTEVYVGQGNALVDKPTAAKRYGNAYLTGDDGILIDEVFAQPTYDTTDGDLLVLRVTGRPQDGVEQTREFLWRVQPDRTLKPLASEPSPQVW